MNNRGKVLFVIHDLYQDDNHFPMGPGYLAAVLEKNGHEVSVYDQSVFHYSNKELAKFIEENKFDMICLGFLAARFKETIIDLTQEINNSKKDAWLVLGGHGPSPIPEYILRTTGADIISIGEGEETLVELLECKLAGGGFSDKLKIPGIAFMNEDKFYINSPRPLIKDINTIPLPAWHLFPMDIYTTCLNVFVEEPSDKAFAILTSRGCIGKCSFCYRLEKGIRFRSVDKVLDEMEYLNINYGINCFLPLDELFFSSRKRVFEFRDKIKQRGLKIKFDCNARVDIFDEELVDALAEMGCKFVNFGMESSDNNVLKLMGKGTTVEQNIRAAEITKKAGLGIGLNFLWGNPGDSEKSLKDNVAIIKEFHTFSQVRTIRPPTPYPGCPLYYEAIETGKLSGPDDFFNKFKNSDLLTVNYTDIPEDRCYHLLYEANSELVDYYYKNTEKDSSEGENIKNGFYNLYFKGEGNFRGARKYKREIEKE